MDELRPDQDEQDVRADEASTESVEAVINRLAAYSHEVDDEARRSLAAERRGRRQPLVAEPAEDGRCWSSPRRPAASAACAIPSRRRKRRRSPRRSARRSARRSSSGSRSAPRRSRRPTSSTTARPSSSRSFASRSSPALVVSGEIRDPEALGDALKRFFELHKLPKNAVRLGVSNNRIGVRIFEIEGVSDPQQLENAIRFRAEEVLPIPLDQAVLDYVVLEERTARGRNRVAAHPARRRLSGGRRPLPPGVPARRAAGRRHRPRGVRAPARASASHGREDTTGALVGDHDRARPNDDRRLERHALRVRARAGLGRLVAERRHRARARSRADGGRVDQAAALVRRHPSQVEGLTDEQVAKVKDGIQRALAAFARELVSSLQFYQAQPGCHGIGEVLMTGGAAQMDGLPEAVGELVGVPVRLGDPFRRAQVRAEGRAPGAAGLVLGRHRPRDRGLMRAVNLLPRDADVGSSRGRTLPLFVAVGCVAAVTVFAGFLGMSGVGSADERRGDLELTEAAIARIPARSGSRVAPDMSRGAQRPGRCAPARALDARSGRQGPAGALVRVPEDVWLNGLTVTVPTETGPAGAPPGRRHPARRQRRPPRSRSREPRTRRRRSHGSSRGCPHCRRSRTSVSPRALASSLRRRLRRHRARRPRRSKKKQGSSSRSRDGRPRPGTDVVNASVRSRARGARSSRSSVVAVARLPARGLVPVRLAQARRGSSPRRTRSSPPRPARRGPRRRGRRPRRRRPRVRISSASRRRCPRARDQASLLLELDLLARKANVTIASVSMQEPSALTGGSTAIPVAVTVSGTYRHITRFVRQMRSLAGLRRGEPVRHGTAPHRAERRPHGVEGGRVPAPRRCAACSMPTSTTARSSRPPLRRLRRTRRAGRRGPPRRPQGRRHDPRRTRRTRAQAEDLRPRRRPRAPRAPRVPAAEAPRRLVVARSGRDDQHPVDDAGRGPARGRQPHRHLSPSAAHPAATEGKITSFGVFATKDPFVQQAVTPVPGDRGGRRRTGRRRREGRSREGDAVDRLHHRTVGSAPRPS